MEPVQNAPHTSTEAERRLGFEQALASTRIEGHRPTAEFLADVEAVIGGDMTHDQARAAALARAQAAEAAALAAGLTSR
jgi:DNA-binding LacI/PurR family transcriptional regulator